MAFFYEKQYSAIFSEKLYLTRKKKKNVLQYENLVPFFNILEKKIVKLPNNMLKYEKLVINLDCVQKTNMKSYINKKLI